MTALPAFSVTGNLFEILASIADDEIEVQSWQSAILHFESNITKGVLVWDGVVYSRPPAVTVNVGSDGAIATAEEPILLLASDPGLGLENLQWRVSIRVKGRLVASWSFAAAEDGETVDLADVVPVASTTATQILRGPAGPAGRSVDNITLDDDELVFAMSTAPDHRVQIPALDDAASAASVAQFAAGVAQGHAADAQGYAADAQGYATDAQNAADTATNAAELAEGHAETAAEAALEATNAVADAIEDLVGGAPNTLDTLQELANALGNDPNFATTITNLIANKQAKFMTGTCATATGTAAKTVTLDSPWASHTPAAGDFFLVTFTNGSSAAAPTLAINGSTARAIRSPNNGTASSQVQMSAGATNLYYFDGTYMQQLGVTHNSTYGEIAEADITNASSNTTGLITGRRAEALLASEASKARTLTNKTISGADNALSNINADSLVDGTTNKVFTATEKTKLAGIASGATANDTDANLKNRANHTGTQAASTISDFAETVRDIMGTALVAGTNVTIDVDDVEDTITISVPGTLENSKVYFAVDHGVSPDNADNAPALNALLSTVASTGGTIILPPGDLVVDESVGLGEDLISNVRLSGVPGRTKIISSGNFAPLTGAWYRSTISDIIFDAGDYGAPAMNIHMVESTVERCLFDGWTGYGVKLNDGTYGDLGLLNRFQDNHVVQNTGIGVWQSYRWVDSWITGNNIGSTQANLSLEGGPLRVLDNHLDGDPMINIELRGNKRITIAGNILEGSRNEAITYVMPPWLTADAPQVHIADNLFSNGGKASAGTYSAIRIEGVATDKRVSGFTINDNVFACEDEGAGWKHVIEASHTDSLVAVGNQWSVGHLDDALGLTDCTGVVATGNSDGNIGDPTKAGVSGSATGIWMGSTLPGTGTAGVLYVVV